MPIIYDAHNVAYNFPLVSEYNGGNERVYFPSFSWDNKNNAWQETVATKSYYVNMPNTGDPGSYYPFRGGFMIKSPADQENTYVVIDKNGSREAWGMSFATQPQAYGSPVYKVLFSPVTFGSSMCQERNFSLHKYATWEESWPVIPSYCLKTEGAGGVDYSFGDSNFGKQLFLDTITLKVDNTYGSDLGGFINMCYGCIIDVYVNDTAYMDNVGVWYKDSSDNPKADQMRLSTNTWADVPAWARNAGGQVVPDTNPDVIPLTDRCSVTPPSPNHKYYLATFMERVARGDTYTCLCQPVFGFYVNTNGWASNKFVKFSTNWYWFITVSKSPT